ncbi:MAG: hypothetical protein WA324_23210 [Bryobacteraceae bacterium]
MARYLCPDLGCTLSLKLSDPPVCPQTGHLLNLYSKPGVIWVDRTESGCLRDPENKDALLAVRMSEDKFSKTDFSMRNFVPGSARGLFDVDFSPAGRTVTITVRLFCDFVMGEARKDVPPKLAEGYRTLTDWTESEKPRWMAEAVMSVANAWDNKRALVLRRPGWRELRVNPIFKLDFVSSKGASHVASTVTKIPPVDPEFFNCGGTYVGLDQIIQNNPQQVSKAALTSQSGIPVTMEAGNLGIARDGVIHYNVMAHEFGHMIGLPDEYENPQRSPTATQAQNAKAIHKEGTLALAQKCRIAYSPFGPFTESIMSRGSNVLKCHFVTVWQALTIMTKDFVEEEEWEIA